MEKKDGAKTLYMQGFQQIDIAEILGVDKKTVNLWVKHGNWDEKRTEHNLFKETAQEQIMRLINHQLKILSTITSIQENKIDDSLSIQELQKLLISKGDIDALQKLFTTIKGKETEWDEIVKIIRAFIEYIESNDMPTAKKVQPFATDFLNEKRKEL